MRCTSSELISESERRRNNLSPSPVHSPSGSNDEMDRSGGKSAAAVAAGAVPSSAFLKREASSLSVTMSSKSDVLILVFREGDGMSGGDGSSSGLADCQTFQTTVNQITKMHYSFSDGRIAVRLVSCPPICKSVHNLFSLLCPSSEKDDNEMLRSAILPLIAVAQPDYSLHLDAVVDKANAVYSEFLQSPEGQAFTGLVSIVSLNTFNLLGFFFLGLRCWRLSRRSSSLRRLESSLFATFFRHESTFVESVASRQSQLIRKQSSPVERSKGLSSRRRLRGRSAFAEISQSFAAIALH